MITLWHNPRCSKSRQALALLEAAGADLNVRRYLEDAPDAEEIKEVLIRLGTIPAIQMMRTVEKAFKELNLTRSAADADLIAAMAAHPILIERPIAITPSRAIIGRPPEHVADLL